MCLSHTQLLVITCWQPFTSLQHRWGGGELGGCCSRLQYLAVGLPSSSLSCSLPAASLGRERNLGLQGPQAPEMVAALLDRHTRSFNLSHAAPRLGHRPTTPARRPVWTQPSASHPTPQPSFTSREHRSDVRKALSGSLLSPAERARRTYHPPP